MRDTLPWGLRLYDLPRKELGDVVFDCMMGLALTITVTAVAIGSVIPFEIINYGD